MSEVRVDNITAEEARAITNANRTVDVSNHIIALTTRVREVAQRGKNSFDPWAYLASIKQSPSEVEQSKKIRSYFVERGFKWVDHPDQDPGHPCSRSFTELSW